MDQREKAIRLAQLHVKGTPVVLYNAWDAGSAKAIVAAGSEVAATSSWSVAAAHGYSDGEQIPLDLAAQVVSRIVVAVDVPVTVDIEGGYSDDDDKLAENIAGLLDLGIAGINFEDRVVKGEGLYSVERQARRIAAIRKTAAEKNVPLFINARTDMFFGPMVNRTHIVEEALQRARAYQAAGASGFFVPGLADESLIRQVADGTTLPVNIMVSEGVPVTSVLARAGVSRVSFGPIPYIEAMKVLQGRAGEALGRASR